MSANCRAVAAQVIAATLDGHSLNETLPASVQTVEESERPLLQQLCYGCLRQFHRISGIQQQLLDKPLKAKDADINALILLGLYQLLDMRIPAHASISETVEATRALKKPWASGLVNGILRRCDRERDALLADMSESQSSSHPRWMLRQFAHYGDALKQQIVEANNSHPPMTLRLGQGARDDYIEELAKLGIGASAGALSPCAVQLDQPMDVSRIPGFEQGRVSVQDEAAQLAAPLLNAAAGHRVLDACAAPGGKCCHLLELHPDLEELVAADQDENRLGRVGENLARLQLNAELRVMDGLEAAQHYREHHFDRILLDAPCSGSGVIRRHPDIKILRRESDLEQFAVTQLGLLRALWPLLRNGGQLLYVTCSVFAQENDNVIKAFLEQTAEASIEHIDIGIDIGIDNDNDWGQKTEYGRQLLPASNGPDGLYFARLAHTG